MSKLKGSKVLVIGGAGFIGGFVISELLKHDVKEVIIYDNVPYKEDLNPQSFVLQICFNFNIVRLIRVPLQPVFIDGVFFY